MMLFKFTLPVFILTFSAINCENDKDNIQVFTVATERTDGFERFLESAKQFDIEPTVLGMNEEWKGGDLNGPAGGFKVNLFKKALEELPEDDEKIVLFTDSYDVLFLNNQAEIARKFREFDAKIVFGAEAYCWPIAELASSYSEVTEGKRFLNSGTYIGYLKELRELLSSEIKDTDDDQLYFTKAYLDKELREKLKIKLDHKGEIFQNLNGAANELEIVDVESKEGNPKYKLRNMLTYAEPCIVHGNGPSKSTTLLYIDNYLPNSFDPKIGCLQCKIGQISLDGKKNEEMPSVLLALFVETPTPFLEEQLLTVANLAYPKEKIDLFVHNAVKYHMDHIDDFIKNHGSEYASVKQIVPDDSISEWNARDLSLDHCVKKKCDFYFVLDSTAHLDNPFTLKLLIEQNRSVVAPIMVRHNKVWSNFWGTLTSDGYYARSNDYMDIVHNDIRGLWNVPFVSTCYLVKGKLLEKYDRKAFGYVRDKLDADMAFCANLRQLGVFMYASNRVDFGHLVNPETYDITRTEPDMYQIIENQKDWEQRYIHPDYPENFNPESKPSQPCPDVYWFPIVTKKFCTSLINMMEAFGKWSDGSNKDTRLEGGYEAVPTRDIHMNQVGWETQWLYFLQQYVRPLQELVFLGYVHDPPKSLMNFVVRYRPDEQPSLRPHHDSSTYTINVALNEWGKDYEGGGCKFLRYNCSVTQTKVGWLLMHPGRLTHFHEGLQVTKGTRYIMISFIDP